MIVNLNEQPGQRDFEPLLGRWSYHLKRRLKPLTGSTQWIDLTGNGDCTRLWHGRAQLGKNWEVNWITDQIRIH